MKIPRLVIAAPHGRSGKTTITLGLLAALRLKNYRVQPFKKGPDFIDPGWMSLLSGQSCRNLDPYFMTPAIIKNSVITYGSQNDLTLIEGAMGLFDGVDLAGSGSTAEIAKITRSPVLLVIDCTRMTRSVAALLQGFMHFDPELKISGVILNKVARPRHEALLRKSVAEYCNLPVLGVFPKVTDFLIPDRHLGLIPAGERSELAGQIQQIGEAALQHLEWEKILELAALAPALDKETELIARQSQGKGLKLGYCWDEAFSFYYPENLEALEKTGAKLEKINTLHQAVLPPDLDGLYIGGGFPEVFAAELEANHSLRRQIRCKAEQGMPIYAECGGLIYLSQSLTWQGQSHHMVGLFPLEIEMTTKPQGHGYEKVRVEKPNPYFAVGSELIGHEFHNTRVLFQPDFQLQDLVFGLQKGSGMGQVEGIKRDGITQKRVLASYLHIHASAVPQWASAFVHLAEQYQKERLHK